MSSLRSLYRHNISFLSNLWGIWVSAFPCMRWWWRSPISSLIHCHISQIYPVIFVSVCSIIYARRCLSLNLGKFWSGLFSKRSCPKSLLRIMGPTWAFWILLRFLFDVHESWISSRCVSVLFFYHRKVLKDLITKRVHIAKIRYHLGAIMSPRSLFRPEVETFLRESFQLMFLHSLDRNYSGMLYNSYKCLKTFLSFVNNDFDVPIS